MEEVTKTIKNDEIEIALVYKDGYPAEIKIDVKDTNMYPPLPMDNPEILSRFRDMASQGIMQLLKSIGQQTQLRKQRTENVFIKKQCPNCKTENMKLNKPCCDEAKKLKAKGIVAVLHCDKCGHSIWVTEKEMNLVKE